ncbi:hypothetical protein [Oceanobacillus kimchii]|uniref:Uncharacterized protein n=1 Tax=Oceanobacillus kimchii TaxID=746691 RepID=A0ABQ5TJI4_9BACI|nr:hypothetical protein [Oceanobacillus kimchii]GLO66165.1 hypothetical protein MACH08_19490 [Oceanobacillus kimchii]
MKEIVINEYNYNLYDVYLYNNHKCIASFIGFSFVQAKNCIDQLQSEYRLSNDTLITDYIHQDNIIEQIEKYTMEEFYV